MLLNYRCSPLSFFIIHEQYFLKQTGRKYSLLFYRNPNTSETATKTFAQHGCP